MKQLKLIHLFGILLLLTSCSSNQENLIGEWVDEETETSSFLIEKFGKNLTLVNSEKKFPLNQSGENFIINISGQEIPLVYDKESNRLLYNGKTYLRYDESSKRKLLGVYYLYNETSKEILEENSVEIRRLDNKQFHINFSDKSRKDGELQLSKDDGLVYYTGMRHYDGGRIFENVSLEEMEGKECVKFEGWAEGDNWIYIYCQK